jgi:predicted small secreted protein
MTRKFAIVAMVAATLILTGCNTVKGVGRDVKSAGKAVERAAD